LLPIAALSGWLAGRNWSANKGDKSQRNLSRKYIVGLNYLLNEQPDKAIDTFIQLLEVDSETVETHLALGSLFRRRGEVDRALRLHQNIIARPVLAGELRQLAMFELGLDYLSAGVLDRAEHIFDDLKAEPQHNISSLRQLLSIYQAIKDWQRAINTAQQLYRLSGDNLTVECGHFYCELAEAALLEGKTSKALASLKNAQRIDNTSVRASLMQASIALNDQRWKDAVKYYKKLLKQDNHFFSEALAGLEQAFEALNDQKGLKKLLIEATNNGSGTKVMLAAANKVRLVEGDRAAAEYISLHLRESPSMRGLQTLIELHLIHSNETARESLQLLQEVVDSLLESKPSHRCESCGFECKQLYWNCPGCKSWGLVKPILGIEGD
jgi:lipopolysaccharide biosynthesis regulator YciM